MAVIYKDDFLNRVLADPDPYLAKDIQQASTAVEHYKVKDDALKAVEDRLGAGMALGARPATWVRTEPDPIRVMALDYAIKVGAMQQGGWTNDGTILRSARAIEKFLRGLVDIED